jgi:hypothetical protein
MVFRERHKHTDAPDWCGLVRARRERPRSHTADERDELPPPHVFTLAHHWMDCCASQQGSRPDFRSGSFASFLSMESFRFVL